MKEDDEMIFIFAIGINDSQFIHSLNSPKISVVKFQDNFQKFINFAQKFSQKIIFVGLTSVDEAKTIPWDIDKSYKNEHIKRYNQIIKQICEENKIHFIKLFDKFSKINYKKLLKDGLHPNSEGHQKIFEIVRDFLEEKKII